MKLELEILWFAAGPKAQLYTVRLPGQAQNETVRFFSRMQASPRYRAGSRFAAALRILLDYLDRIARLEGAVERLFRPGEGLGQALPIDKGPLRLYCYRFDDRHLLVCGGGIKTSQTVQESPDCLPHFQFMNHVVSALRRQHIGPGRLPTDPHHAFILKLDLPENEYPG